MIVDDVDDTQEIVVKPLRNLLKGLSMFAGATIMGDGRAILILDVPGFAVHAQVLSELRPANADRRTEAGRRRRPNDEHSLLLFAGDDEARMAVPLSNVMRLEEFAAYGRGALGRPRRRPVHGRDHAAGAAVGRC